MASHPIDLEPKHHPGPPGGYGLIGQAVHHAGLEQLRTLNRISIHQKCTCCGCWVKNSKYKVKNDNDVEIYDILEETSCPMRCICCIYRAFEIRVMDNTQTEVMHFKRPIRCGQCYGCYGNYFLPCLLQEMEVCSPPFDGIGTIRQNFSLCTPYLSGVDAAGRELFHVTGSFCRPPCCVDLEFQILAADNQTKIGEITKKWTSCCNEMCTNAHEFEVRFPTEADVKEKAMMLSAAILIDYMHFN